MQQPAGRSDALRLRALTGAGGSEEYDEHLADEPLVVAHQELGFELLHGVEDDGDNDEEACAGDGEGLDIADEADEERDDGDEAEEERATPRDAVTTRIR
jgi:hypothetical protein